MAGAVINGLNIRLDADAIAFQLNHGGAKVLFVDREFSATIEAALAQLDKKPLVIDVDDAAAEGGDLIGDGIRGVSRRRRSRIRLALPADEWRRSRWVTPRAPPAIPRAWSPITAALT